MTQCCLKKSYIDRNYDPIKLEFTENAIVCEKCFDAPTHLNFNKQSELYREFYQTMKKYYSGNIRVTHKCHSPNLYFGSILVHFIEFNNKIGIYIPLKFYCENCDRTAIDIVPSVDDVIKYIESYYEYDRCCDECGKLLHGLTKSAV